MARVLVVDDDPVILRLLELNLELEGHQVITAADGEVALVEAARQAPEVILLDVMMPRLDGFTTCRRLRDDPTTAQIPVVLVSARAQPGDVARGSEVGADAYVTKPFDPFELLEVVQRLARDGRAATARPDGDR